MNNNLFCKNNKIDIDDGINDSIFRTFPFFFFKIFVVLKIDIDIDNLLRSFLL